MSSEITKSSTQEYTNIIEIYTAIGKSKVLTFVALRGVADLLLCRNYQLALSPIPRTYYTNKRKLKLMGKENLSHFFFHYQRRSQVIHHVRIYDQSHHALAEDKDNDRVKSKHNSSSRKKNRDRNLNNQSFTLLGYGNYLNEHVVSIIWFCCLVCYWTFGIIYLYIIPSFIFFKWDFVTILYYNYSTYASTNFARLGTNYMFTSNSFTLDYFSSRMLPTIISFYYLI